LSIIYTFGWSQGGGGMVDVAIFELFLRKEQIPSLNLS